MRKVQLTMKENSKYQEIRKLVHMQASPTAKKRVATKLGCTVRTINRLMKRYNKEGKQAFKHGNRNRKPKHTIDDATRKNIIKLYSEKYYDFNFKHFQEFLDSEHQIFLSYSTIYNILTHHDTFLSPMAERATKRAYAKRRREKERAKEQIDPEEIEILRIPDPIIPLEDSHPRRERVKYFGELIQLDASVHRWFGEEKAHLHLAIDDATSMLVGAYFDKQETLHGYYHVTKQILETYGIPFRFVTDNRTVFEAYSKGKSTADRDTTTQFGFMCKNLGIDIKTTSVPQAKGRVERSFGTHQSRLINELRLSNINSIEEANVFLQHYIVKHNKRFALPINDNKFSPLLQDNSIDLNLMLAVCDTRIVDKGHCIKFQNKYYTTYHHGNRITLRPKTEVLVVKSFDGTLYLTIEDKAYNLVEVEVNKSTSSNFDSVMHTNAQAKKAHIPPENHPWRKSEFLKFAESFRIQHYTFLDLAYSEANHYEF